MFKNAQAGILVYCGTVSGYLEAIPIVKDCFPHRHRKELTVEDKRRPGYIQTSIPSNFVAESHQHRTTGTKKRFLRTF
jgi:hypothetical protein